MRMEFLWLALIVVFAVIEGATTALTTVWFIGGALAALAAALLHAELWLQITLFFAVSVVLDKGVEIIRLAEEERRKYEDE